MVSANTLCKNVLNVKNTVIENFNLYSDEDGMKHIRIKARPNKWHENDCPFCHKSCTLEDYGNTTYPELKAQYDELVAGTK